MRDGMLRVSEAAALTWSDIESDPDGTGRLLIRRSKTDPEGSGAVAFVSAPTMAALGSIRTRALAGESVFGLRSNHISKRIKKAGPGSRAGGRLQRSLAARGDGAGPRAGWNRDAQPHDGRALAYARDASALHPQ